MPHASPTPVPRHNIGGIAEARCGFLRMRHLDDTTTLLL